MVLSAEERRARDEELLAKRQKKEEERQQVLRQAEADRKAREERFAPDAASAAPPQAAAPAAAKGPEPATVRLQIRCPHWNRNVVFTCFSPDSTLAEVAQALREELIKGAVGSGDGRAPSDADAARARVPDAESIVFVEQVPPRKRWVSPDDKQQSLRSAGLCPSSALLAEAPPVEPPPAQAPAEQDPGGAGGGQAPGGAGGDDAPHPQDGSSDEESPSAGARRPPPAQLPDDDDESGSEDDDDDPAGPGKGFGKGFGKGTGSGTFAGGWGPPRPGGRPPGWGDRAGPGQEAHQFPEGGGQTLGSGGATGATGGAALLRTGGAGPAIVAPAGGTPSGAEQQRAARDARLAALERRGLGAPAQGAGAPASLGDRQVKGHMGDGRTKADRADERAAILQKLKEDQEDRELRRPAAAAPAPAAAEKGPSGPRLQIRCPDSKRIHIPVGLGEESLLGGVRDAAAAELGIEEPVLSLGFPPWTEFKAEQYEKSLVRLGLCPSANLLIKSAKPAPAAAEAPAAEEGDAAAPARRGPGGEVMTEVALKEEGWCDKCSKTLKEGDTAFECKQIDLVLCKQCADQSDP